MGRIRTPWDRVAEVDPSDAGSYSGQKMDNPVETYVEAVASALPEPRPEPRVRFEAKVLRNGKVELPLDLISPVLALLGSWWREQPNGGFPAPEPTPVPRKVSPDLTPLPDDAFIHQRDVRVDKDVFLRLARAKAFPSSKKGKLVFAMWADVKAAFANYGTQPKPSVAKTKPAAPQDGLDDLRRDLGLVQKGK